MMTYRFEILAFKKDELSKILQSIDATFSFDHQKICSEDVSSVEQIKPLEFEVAPTNTHLVKMDLFTISEATCLLSDYNHNEVGSYVYDDDFRENCISYVNVESLIKAGIRSGKLDTTFNEEITSQALKQFAFDKGFIIDGFNNHLLKSSTDFDTTKAKNKSTIERQFESCKRVMATQKENLDQLRERVAELEAENRTLIEKIESVEPEPQMHPRTANNAAKVIGALAEMNKLNLTEPYGQANKDIQETLQRLGSKIDKEPIASWLKQANEQLK